MNQARPGDQSSDMRQQSAELMKLEVVIGTIALSKVSLDRDLSTQLLSFRCRIRRGRVDEAHSFSVIRTSKRVTPDPSSAYTTENSRDSVATPRLSSHYGHNNQLFRSSQSHPSQSDTLTQSVTLPDPSSSRGHHLRSASARSLGEMMGAGDHSSPRQFSTTGGFVHQRRPSSAIARLIESPTDVVNDEEYRPMTPGEYARFLAEFNQPTVEAASPFAFSSPSLRRSPRLRRTPQMVIPPSPGMPRSPSAGPSDVASGDTSRPVRNVHSSLTSGLGIIYDPRAQTSCSSPVKVSTTTQTDQLSSRFSSSPSRTAGATTSYLNSQTMTRKRPLQDLRASPETHATSRPRRNRQTPSVESD